jgi:hypothetical protein
MTRNIQATFAQPIQQTVWSALGAVLFGGLLPIAMIATMFQV